MFFRSTKYHKANCRDTSQCRQWCGFRVSSSLLPPTRNFFKHRSRFQNYLEGSTLIVCIPVSISTLCSIHLLLLTFLSYMKKNWKSLLPAKRRKRTLSSISTDTIPNSFNYSCHSVYPEKDKLILVLAIPGFLTTLVKNSGDNGHCNYTDDMRWVQFD